MDVLTRRPALAAPTSPARTGRRALVSAQQASVLLVAAATCGAAVWIAVQLLQRDDRLGTPAYDQAFFQQVIWNLDHGRGFVSSFNQNSFLGLHFSPLLLVPAAFELVWPDPRTLTLLNAVSVALAAPAAFVFLRAAFSPSHLGHYLAAGLAAALPFTPAMQEAARAGFHPETMALPAALVCGWAGLTRRPLVMWTAAAVSLLAKEDQVYTVAVIGLLVAVRGRPRMHRQGLILMATAVIWGVALFIVIMPALRAGAPPDTANYYGWLGAFPGALLAPIRERDAVLSQLNNAEGLTAAAALILCLGGLPLLRPTWALLILPPLIADLLSRHYPQAELRLQYGLLLVAPALVATALGGRRALALVDRLVRTDMRRRLFMAPATAAALLAVAVPALVLGALVGSLPPAGQESSAFGRQPGLSQLTLITASIPSNAPVAADDDIAAPLASRPTIYVLPRTCADCYVVVDRVPSLQSFMSPDQRAVLLAGLPEDRRLLADDGRFQLWSPIHG